MHILKIGFFASHGGSNMQAIIDACKEGRLNGDAKVVISNNSSSKALKRAEENRIPNYHLSSHKYPNSNTLDKVIFDTLIKNEVNIIILAGYMKKLGQLTLEHYRGRILNIHPSLLPKYGGHGMYGRNVHEAVLAAKEKVTGVTIHIVDEEYDTGTIICQHEIKIKEEDTVDTLSERVLKYEHEKFVETLIKITTGEVVLK